MSFITSMPLSIYLFMWWEVPDRFEALSSIHLVSSQIFLLLQPFFGSEKYFHCKKNLQPAGRGTTENLSYNLEKK